MRTARWRREPVRRGLRSLPSGAHPRGVIVQAPTISPFHHRVRPMLPARSNTWRGSMPRNQFRVSIPWVGSGVGSSAATGSSGVSSARFHSGDRFRVGRAGRLPQSRGARAAWRVVVAFHPVHHWRSSVRAGPIRRAIVRRCRVGLVRGRRRTVPRSPTGQPTPSDYSPVTTLANSDWPRSTLPGP